MRTIARTSLPLSLGIALATAAVAQFAPQFASPASAESVTACSRYGKGCITAPVRRTRQGLEVRFPGGTWVGCSGDCREKLRDESIDFWDTHRPETGNGGGNRN